MTAITCHECGAAVPSGASCLDNFHALLFLESKVRGGPGGLSHFYAVASFGLQHPETVGYTVETLEGLRSAVADVLANTATLQDVRHRVRRAARKAGRVTRRTGDRVPHWPVEDWPITITDVVGGGTEGYHERVEAWARSIIATVAGLDP